MVVAKVVGLYFLYGRQNLPTVNFFHGNSFYPAVSLRPRSSPKYLKIKPFEEQVTELL